MDSVTCTAKFTDWDGCRIQKKIKGIASIASDIGLKNKRQIESK
jgi:hypothetical protein